VSGQLCVGPLRGVNVGGHGKLPRKELVARCEELGLTQLLLLHAPDGIGRSKLAPAVARKLGVPAAAPNEKPLRALRQLLG